MSLLSTINDTFPAHKDDDGRVFVLTRRGAPFEGKIRHCDDRAMVLDTPRGTIVIIPRAIVAISDRREALKPSPEPPGA